jgi:hypothetical protein
VVVSVSLLLKVVIGIFFFKKNNSRALRLYFMFRYIYNMIVVYPLIILFRFVTGTYTLNYFLAGGILLICELTITVIYCKHLCIKAPLENVEDIPGFKVMKIM